MIFVFAGMLKRGLLAKGNREVGHVFDLMNFNEDKYIEFGADARAFIPAIRWSLSDELGQLQYGDGPIYRNGGRVPIKDRPATIYIEVSQGIKSFFISLAVMCFIVTVGLFVFLIKYWNAKTVKAAQPKMTVCVLLGGLLISGRVFNSSQHITHVSCTAGIWLGHLGFFLIFSTLLLKTWRIHRLVNSGLKRIRIQENYVLSLLWGGVFLLVCYLAVVTEEGGLHSATLCSDSGNQETCMMKCHFTTDAYHEAIFLVEFVVLMYAAYLCYSTKGAPDSVNESAYIAGGNCL